MRRGRMQDKISQIVLERPRLNKRMIKTKHSFEQVKQMLGKQEKKKL